MKKRFVSMFVAFVIIVTTVFSINTTIAFGATSGSCGNNVNWSYNETSKTLTLTGAGATNDYGVGVTKRVPWYSYKDQITTIVVSNGVTELGQLVFYNLTKLTSVSLPSSLEIIDGGTLNYGAFRECTALQTITLPEGVKTIGAMAFRGCSSLRSIRFPNTLTSLGAGAFRECSNLETVTYGTGLKTTGVEAFYDSGVRYVNFTSAIEKIDSYSFFNTKIVSIEIPEYITEIGTRAFANCTFMDNVTVYNSDCVYGGIGGNDPFNGSSQTITFYGHSASTTQTYANEKGYNFVSIDGCNHENKKDVVINAPTCDETGICHTVCADCDFLVSEYEIPALGHKWSMTGTDDQTELNGHVFTYYECLNDGCDAEKIVVEHKKNIEGYYTYENSATCTQPGLETYTCLVDGCGNVDRRIARSGNHVLGDEVVTIEPTCTEKGSITGICTKCGEEAVKDIPALGHNYEPVDDVDNVEEDGHTYIIYACTVCGEESIEPTHVEWVDGFYESRVVSEAHCVVNGLRADTCSVDGCNKIRTVQLPANGEHVWYETTRTEPTCTATGKIYYACENCTMTRSENIPALGHDYVLNEDASVSPNCTDAGYNTYKCTVCNATKKDVLSPTGHTPDTENAQVISVATCTEDGQMLAVCTVCGEDVLFVQDALGHDYEDVSVSVEDKPGHSQVTPTCTRCGQTKTANVVHEEWIDGYYTSRTIIEGSCTSPEYVRDTCDLCGETRNNTKPAAGHNYSFYQAANDGKLEYKCSICNNVDSRSPQTIMVIFQQYINTKTADKTLGYLCDVNLDGIVTAKDYALIVKARQIEIANQK